MGDYRLSPRAVRDLDAILDWSVGRWGRRRGEAYLRDLSRVFDLIAEHPGIARLRSETAPPVRVHPHQSHLVIYRADPTVEILRVMHHRQDWLGILL